MSQLFDLLAKGTRAYVQTILDARPVPQQFFEDVCNEKENNNKESAEAPPDKNGKRADYSVQ